MLTPEQLDYIAAGNEPEIHGLTSMPSLDPDHEPRVNAVAVANELHSIMRRIEAVIGAVGETDNLCEAWERVRDELGVVCRGIE